MRNWKFIKKLNIKISFIAVPILAIVALLISSSNAAAIIPYIAERVNLKSGNAQTTGNSFSAAQPPQISQDGRYVAFSSRNSQYVPGDTNAKADIFVRDRKLDTVVRASVSDTGGQISSPLDILDFELSKNGRFLVFLTDAPNVVSGDTDTYADVFVRDLKNNTTTLASTTSTGVNPNDHAYSAAFSRGIDVSANGRYIIYASRASNIVPNDTNGAHDVFIFDQITNTTTLLSKAQSSNNTANGASFDVSLSCDGTYASFSSTATDMASGDTNNTRDIFVLDRINGNSIKNITLGADNTNFGGADISCNGSVVTYASNASNLVANDTNNIRDIFAYDLYTEQTQLVSVDSFGNQMTSGTVYQLTSGATDFSGRYIVFSSSSENLVANDTNIVYDIFIRDLQEQTTQIVSRRNSSTQTNNHSTAPSLSLNGKEVIYLSGDSGLVSGDTNNQSDIFVSQTGI